MILLLMTSICLGSSVDGSVWPYHGSIGLAQPATGAVITTGTVGVSLAQPTPLAISLKPPSAATLVAGPNSGATIVKGAVAGPVTIKAGSSAPVGVIPVVGVISASSQGTIKTVGPSDGSITVSGVAGIAGGSTTAVVGPSTGPVVVAGPDAVPAVVPVVAVPEVVRIADLNGSSGGSVVVKGVGPIVSKEVLENTVLVSEPGVKILTPPSSSVVVASESAGVAISGPAGGNVAVSGPQASSAVISGPSGTIATSGSTLAVQKQVISI